MKILFDQGTPVPLRRQLTGHQVTTAHEQGWATLSNGIYSGQQNKLAINFSLQLTRTFAISKSLPIGKLPFSF